MTRLNRQNLQSRDSLYVTGEPDWDWPPDRSSKKEKNMKRTAVVRTLVIGFGTVVALVTIHGIDARAVAGQSAQSSPQTDQRKACSIASLHGTFGFTATGTVNGIGPVARVGWETFDGKGNASGTATTSLNGSINPSTFTATYTVNPNCTGTATEDDSVIGVAHDDLVIVDAGREIRAISVDPGGTLTADWKKQFPNGVHNQ